MADTASGLMMAPDGVPVEMVLGRREAVEALSDGGPLRAVLLPVVSGDSGDGREPDPRQRQLRMESLQALSEAARRAARRVRRAQHRADR